MNAWKSIWVARWDIESIEVAQSLHNLAEVLRRKGDFKTAESLYREAVFMV